MLLRLKILYILYITLSKALLLEQNFFFLIFYLEILQSIAIYAYSHVTGKLNLLFSRRTVPKQLDLGTCLLAGLLFGGGIRTWSTVSVAMKVTSLGSSLLSQIYHADSQLMSAKQFCQGFLAQNLILLLPYFPLFPHNKHTHTH